MATCITGVEREPMPLDIALLGYNMKLTDYGFKQLIRNNIDQVERVDRDRRTAYLKDGTMIKAIFDSNPHRLYGYRFDQLMLFDDDRWLIYTAKSEEIHNIVSIAMRLSNVPKEFQILHYEDIR